jgi:hypothetical protein
MSDIVNIPVANIKPDTETILKAQGIDVGRAVDNRVSQAADTALKLFSDLANPVAIVREVTADEFALIYHGLGRNADPAPIEKIYQQADYLMLFAATVGRALTDRIGELFARNEFVSGNALDVAASEGTDRISHFLEDYFTIVVTSSPDSKTGLTVFAYSPGYCGWHISAQKKLFEALHPETIGITLRDSFLMEPLKSISGVLIAGDRSIHQIDNSYDFCVDCSSEPCRARIMIDEETKT